MSHDLPTDDICIYIDIHMFVCMYTPREGTRTCQSTGTNITAVYCVTYNVTQIPINIAVTNHGQNLLQTVNVAPPHPGT